MAQVDNEYVGDDFTASIKGVNPFAIHGGISGVWIGSWLQSLTPSLALGLEGVWQREGPNAKPVTMIRYAGRYKTSNWILSGDVSPQGAINASYWRRLTDKVEAGADLQLQFAPGPGGAGGMFGGMRREGVATVGAKYDFTASTFRAQLDSTGKVSAYLDKRITQAVGLTFAGEIDQVKVRAFFAFEQPTANNGVQQTSKIGLAVSFESAPEELMTGDIRACSPPM